jgi:hypothetical protein
VSVCEAELTVACDNAAAELLIVDSDFKLVAHGPSPLQARIEPGIYALKAKIGAEVTERLELIEAREAPYVFNLAAPQFESPLPLDGTVTNREYQHGSLEQFTRSNQPFIALDPGSAAQSVLVLYVRDTSRRNFELTGGQGLEYAKGFEGFRLLDAAGRQRVDFDAQALKRIEDGYIGARVQLAAGSYVLAWGHGDQQTCLAINTVPGWALQVFLRLQPISAGSVQMRPDFCDAAFAFDRIDSGYSSAREDFRTMEAARLALLDRRDIASGQMLHSILTGKSENPMLGLYGGHLLVAAPTRDSDLLSQVIANTAAILGPLYPDLVALAWAHESVAGKRPAGFDARPWPQILADITGPPLLTPSWDLLLKCAEAARLDIDKLPVFCVAGELAVSGIVLTWERRQEKPAVEQADLPPRPAAFDGVSERPAGVSAPRAPASAPPPAASSPLASVAKMLWRTVVKLAINKPDIAATLAKPAITQPDTPAASFPTLDLKIGQIDTPQAAADAIRRLAKKAAWGELLRLLQRAPGELGNLASFSPLQRDLVSTLARASLESDVLEGIDADHVSSIMRAHRVPLTTVAGALRALDFVAVSAEVIRRVKAVVSSAPGTA